MDMFELGEQPYTDADAQWDQFVKEHPHGSLLQTAVWARLKSRFGWTSERVYVKKDGQIVGGAQVLFRGAVWNMVKIAYVPHGPLINWANSELVELTLNHLDIAAHRNRASILKMEPLLWQDEYIQPDQWSRLCAKHNCITPTDTIQPPRTVRIDLTADEDAMLKGMKQKTRYNTRLGPKKGVTVRRGTRHDIPTFTKMMRVTGQRNQFGVHDPKYYEVAFDLFNQLLPGSVALFIAEYEGEPLAGVMAFAYGRQGSYLYGASNNEHREKMPAYIVQWEAMKWAKEQGCDFYDMWGVPDEELETLEAQFKERNDGLWGVYRFKRGWGGQVMRTVGPADRVYNQLTYRLYKRRRGG